MNFKYTANILLVEDNEADVILAKILLNDALSFKYNLYEASMISDAKSIAESNNLSLILLDLNLPDGVVENNISMMRKICPDVPIVILSDESDDHIARIAIQMGCEDFIVKGTINDWQFNRTITHAIERRKLYSELEHQAHYDALTGIPNRKLFQNRLEQSVERAKRYEHKMAIIYIDIDEFKPINDQFGHEIGDKVLIEIAKRIKTSIRTIDTVARLGGDEFSVILDQISMVEDALKIAKNLINKISASIRVDSNIFSVGASIGISIYPEVANSPESLVIKADDAMYVAKNNGKNQFCLA